MLALELCEPLVHGAEVAKLGQVRSHGAVDGGRQAASANQNPQSSKLFR